MESQARSSRVAFIEEYVQELTPKDGSILDVGCGDMYLAKSLPGYTWTGIDVNTDTNNGKAVNHDLESFPYPFPDASFDTIVCSEVLEHLFDPVKVTKEIARLLKPTGVYILSTPNFDWAENHLQQFRPIVFDPFKSWTKEHIHCYNLTSHDLILAQARLSRFRYVGADAHYGSVFREAAIVLARYFHEKEGLPPMDAEKLSMKLIGEMFKETSHTIIICARK